MFGRPEYRFSLSANFEMSFFTDCTERMEAPEAPWLPRGAPAPDQAPAKLKKFMEGLESRGLFLFQVIFAKTPSLPSEDPGDMASWVRVALTGLKSPLPRQVSQETAETLTKSSVELVAVIINLGPSINQDAEELLSWLGQALVAVAQASSFKSVGPILPLYGVLGMMASAAEAMLPHWSLEEFAVLIESRFRCHEQPLSFPYMVGRVLRGEDSKTARDLLATMSLTLLEDIALDGGAAKGKVATWARKSICLAHDLSLQAVQEPGWLRDPVAPLLIGEFRQARNFMNKLGGGLSEEGDDMGY